MQIYRMGVTTGKIYNDEIQEKADEPTTFVKANSLIAAQFKAFFIMVWAAIKSIFAVRKWKKDMGRLLNPNLETNCKELDTLATVYQNVKEEKYGDPLQETIIAVDFDGTLCEDKWPKIGAMNEELILWLLWRQRHGAHVILWTCREGGKLDEAVKACEEKGLYFDAVNENLESTVGFYGGNKPRKVFATEYIDDRNSKTYWKLPFHPVTTKIIIK